MSEETLSSLTMRLHWKTVDIFSKNVKAFAVEWNVMDSLTLSISTRELEMEEAKGCSLIHT